MPQKVGEQMQIFQLSSHLSVMHKAILNGDISTAADRRMNLRIGRIECFVVKLNNNADEQQNKKYRAVSHPCTYQRPDIFTVIVQICSYHLSLEESRCSSSKWNRISV